jgi:hypothetical protein
MEKKGNYFSTFGRRDFLKTGLAVGVASSIPLDLMPKIGIRRAYAAVLEGLEEITPETRWIIASQALTGMTIGTQKALFDAVGQERYKQIIEQLLTQGGAASKQIADDLGLTAVDAESTAQAVLMVATVSMGPELKFESVKLTPEETIIRGTGCPFWNRVKESGITDDLLSVGSEAWTSSLTKSLNPKVALTVTGAMCRGDAHCEWIYRLQA